jgi:nucleotide-binding universal stress UspA family protein
VVVGVDDSEASLAALRWAADEAQAHGAALIAVHVLDPRVPRLAPYAGRPVDAGLDTRAVDDAARVERMIERAGVEQVKRVFEVGVPSQVLVRCAMGARMLVLGHADHHRRHEDEPTYQAPALGSIARACVVSATCPVVVVPVPARVPSPLKLQPEPVRVAAALGAPLRGGRMIYPTRQPVTVAHG